VATGLQNLIINSFIFNPEDIGACIRNCLPIEIYQDDYQDYDIWREFCYKTLTYINSNFNGIIIVPMTIINQMYVDEIIERLRSDGITVKHYIFSADKPTILSRLSERGATDSKWPTLQIDRCLVALNNKINGIKIDTNNKSLNEIVNEIIKQTHDLI